MMLHSIRNSPFSGLLRLCSPQGLLHVRFMIDSFCVLRDRKILQDYSLTHNQMGSPAHISTNHLDRLHAERRACQMLTSWRLPCRHILHMISKENAMSAQSAETFSKSLLVDLLHAFWHSTQGDAGQGASTVTQDASQKHDDAPRPAGTRDHLQQWAPVLGPRLCRRVLQGSQKFWQSSCRNYATPTPPTQPRMPSARRRMAV